MLQNVLLLVGNALTQPTIKQLLKSSSILYPNAIHLSQKEVLSQMIDKKSVTHLIWLCRGGGEMEENPKVR
jgi:hypothetical protein